MDDVGGLGHDSFARMLERLWMLHQLLSSEQWLVVYRMNFRLRPNISVVEGPLRCHHDILMQDKGTE